jgi:flagellar protein FlgJ
MSNISNFVNKYWPYAQISQKYGIPAIFALAQAALESGWGAKIKGNNVFNIKPGSNWTGKKQLFVTTEYHNNTGVKYPNVIRIEPQANGLYKYTVYDYFRAYDTPAQSFEDHAKLLKGLSRYKKAFNYKDNPEQFAREIAAGGYATATNYANDIIYIMRQMNDILKKKAA